MIRVAGAVPPDPEWESSSKDSLIAGGSPTVGNETMRINSTVGAEKQSNDSNANAPTVRAVWSPDDRWTRIWR